MISRSLFPALALLALVAPISAQEIRFTGAVFADQGKNVGSAAAADLGNEILARIDGKQDPQLKKLIATDALVADLRAKCEEALAKVVAQETSRVTWQTEPVPAGTKRKLVEIDRDFTLDLGQGLEWKQKVKVSWLLSEVKVDGMKPPVRSMIWISFALPTLPALGGVDMTIGGGGSFRTDGETFN